MPSSPLSIGFGVPFYEAIRAAQQRGVVLPDAYYGQLQGLARQHAFSIAGLASLDQLEQVKNSLSVGLQRGISFNKWKKEMLDKGILELPAHRLDNIFRTNIQGNYNRGRWEKIQRNKHRRPYLMYDAINDSRVRPTHLAMDGIIKPADDSFWNAHTPSNGFRSLLPNQRVSGNAILGLKAFYSGKAVEIITSDGDRLSMTAQHPVLTSSGWVSSDEIKQGDELICYSSEVVTSSASGQMDINNTPPCIKDVFDSIATHIRTTVPRAAVNLYGDIKFIEGDVDIVGIDGRLMADLKAEIGKFRDKLKLAKPNTGKVVSSRFSPFFSFFSSSNFKRYFGSICTPKLALFASIKLFPFQFSVNNNVVFFKEFSDSFTTYLKLLSKTIGSHATYIKLNNLDRNWSYKFRPTPASKFIRNNIESLIRCSKNTILFKIFGKSIVTNVASNSAVTDRRPSFVHVDDMFWDWLSSLRAFLSFNLGASNFSGFKFGSFDSSVTDYYIGDPITNPNAVSSIINRHSKLVRVQNVKSVRFFDYHGFVYDLETKSGTILAYGGVRKNHFVLSNCRCRVISLTETQAQARSGRGKGLNKPIKLSKMKPDKGWDYNPGADLTKGIDKAIKQKAESKIKKSMVDKIKAGK